MLNTAQQRTRPDSDTGMKELELKELKVSNILCSVDSYCTSWTHVQMKVEELEEKFSKQKKDLRRGKNKEEELNSEIQELKGELGDTIIMITTDILLLKLYH